MTSPDAPDPNKVQVQLNLRVSWTWNSYLDQLAAANRTSKTQLIRDALEKTYGDPVGTL